MKRISSLVIKSLIAILIVSGTLAVNLEAQSDAAITVSVPFPFTVGAQSVAPGTYRFSLDSSRLEPNPFLLSVLNVKTGQMEMFAVRPERQGRFEEHGRLMFRNSAGRRVLAEVHFPGTDTFSELTQRTRADTMEAKRSSTDSSVSVAQR